ncbi:Growth factor receptor cysteine-rich domain [Trinorchestia longiramus]|nr:Growth factor receptor cysteine-rich domain [Trinorchestia longiramus]
MKESVLVVLLLVAAGEFWLADALRCLPCVKEDCPPAPKCVWGTGLDVCGCCAECYKGPGEKCGGPWNIFGKCGQKMTCNKIIPADGDQYAEFNADGTCVADPTSRDVK